MHIDATTSANADDASDLDDLASGFAPRCPACLGAPEPREVGRAAVWRCSGCGATLIC